MMNRAIKNIILFVIIILSTLSPAMGGAGRLYICKTDDVMKLGKDGLLLRNKATEHQMKRNQQFTFDETTGLLRVDGLPMREMKVIQKGSTENSAIGLYTYRGLGSSGADVFRIMTYRVEMPFMYLDNSTIYTGRCKPL